MTSKNKLLLTAMVMAAALVSGSMSVSASGGGVNSGQLTPRYANSQESATYRIFRSDQWNFINKYKQIFDSKNPDNPFAGKSYLDFTAEDFSKMPLEAEPIFFLALAKYAVESDGSEYGGRKGLDSVDSIRPSLMSREQFFNVLLREGSRRGLLEKVIPFLDSQTADFDTGSAGKPLGWSNKRITISRPLDVPASQRATATVPGMDAAYRDLATALLQNPRQKVVLEEDVSAQMGYKRGQADIFLRTDSSALIAGYIAGANPLFFNGRQGNGVAGPLPLTIGFDSRYSEQQIREAYCAVVPAITQLGRVEGIGHNVAVTAGFLMAREDARSSFAGVEVRLGAFGTLCPATSPVWNALKMGPAIAGIDLLPQQATARP